MEDFLKLLQNNWLGFLLLLGGFLILMLILQRFIKFLARTFSWGRYHPDHILFNEPLSERTRGAGYILISLFVKIINDFRHLLALFIVTIFFFALFYTMVYAGKTFPEKMEGVKSIVASLSGLIGSIIGYYFGESAGKRSSAQDNNSVNASLMKPSEEEIVKPSVPPSSTDTNQPDQG